MNNLFPENSYYQKCSCGTEFLAPKGSLHCHSCLYKKIAELENETAFLQSCLNSGETATKEDRPSSKTTAQLSARELDIVHKQAVENIKFRTIKSKTEAYRAVDRLIAKWELSGYG